MTSQESKPLRARSAAERVLYSRLRPCECGAGFAANGRTLVRKIGHEMASGVCETCRGCGKERELVFAPYPDPTPRGFESPTPSEVITAEQFLALADEALARAEPQVQVARTFLGEILKLIPQGEDRVPAQLAPFIGRERFTRAALSRRLDALPPPTARTLSSSQAALAYFSARGKRPFLSSLGFSVLWPQPTGDVGVEVRWSAENRIVWLLIGLGIELPDHTTMVIASAKVNSVLPIDGFRIHRGVVWRTHVFLDEHGRVSAEVLERAVDLSVAIWSKYAPYLRALTREPVTELPAWEERPPTIDPGLEPGQQWIIRAPNGHELLPIPALRGQVGLTEARAHELVNEHLVTAARWASTEFANDEDEPWELPGTRAARAAGAVTRQEDHARALRALIPAMEVSRPAFAIDRTRVTCAQYEAFVHATQAAPPADWPGGRMPKARASTPVTGVSYDDAARYAAFVGLALPSEAEWELAGGGGDGRRYPWGELEPVVLDEIRADRDTVPADAYPELASPFGVLGMMWSDWEWCEDLFAPREEGDLDAWRKTHAAATPAWRALRGGWRFDMPHALFARNGADPAKRGHGFRCVLRDLGKATLEIVDRPPAPRARPRLAVPAVPIEPAPPAAAGAVEILRSWNDGLRDLRCARGPILAVVKELAGEGAAGCEEHDHGGQHWWVGSGVPPRRHPRWSSYEDELERAECGACKSRDVLVLAFQASSSMGGSFYYDLEVRCARCGVHTHTAFADL